MTTHPNIGTGLLLAAIFAAFFWAQADDARTAAAQEEAEALASREWAGQQVCGPDATPVWEDAKTLLCLRHADQPTRVAGGRP